MYANKRVNEGVDRSRLRTTYVSGYVENACTAALSHIAPNTMLVRVSLTKHGAI